MIREKRGLLALLITLVTTLTYGQKSPDIRTIAEERIRVTASSATVLQWFDKIEKETQITLAYNPSHIDLNKTCPITITGEITIARLLEKVLKGYKFRTIAIPPRKLAIQIERPQVYSCSGSIQEEGSGERLYGAIVVMDDGKGGKWHALSDADGRFRLYLPEGYYRMDISYMGYQPYTQPVYMGHDQTLRLSLKPQLFEIAEVTVKSYKNGGELGELTPSNFLSFSGNDLFSQIWILPGVTGLPTGYNFQVDGGSNDENQLLLDGVPLYHPGHINSLLPVFNGDAVKNIVFHKGFFPTRLEGKLSSVTEVNLKDGDKQEHIRTLTLDMPAAGVTLEGPIIKDKLSYLVSARRSWLDFFDNLFSEDNRMNHSTYDYNAKLSYNLSPQSTLRLMAYGAQDGYHLPYDESGDKQTILRWTNQAYQASFHTSYGKLNQTSSVSYTSYTNRANTFILGFDTEGYVRSGIHSLNAATEFTFSPENMYSARWGAKYTHEVYELASLDNLTQARHEPINQFSLFYDNLIRITPRITTQVGVHFVGYIPQSSRSYYSIQPRFSLKYQPAEKELIYLHFSRMEQFYHYLRFDYLAFPTDFRMPSIDGFKPRSSEHYEAGWKHFLKNGQIEISAYYKTRRNVVAFSPQNASEGSQWDRYIMKGNGDCYGIKAYFYNTWNRWSLQLSYAYSRSREWFDELKDKGKLPSAYDIPHQAGASLSYQLTSHSTLSVGGSVHSGKVIEVDEFLDPLPADQFRTDRQPTNYRLDAGYSYRKDFGKNRLLLLRLGLYNIAGNPPEEEILSYYSVHWYRNCLPYASVSFKF